MLSMGLNVIPLNSAVTSGNSSTTTVLVLGYASGFEGKRMVDDLMNGATPGAAGTVSETHFFIFIPCRNDAPVFLLLDGHKSHVAVDIILHIHVVPAHTSHTG